MITKFVIYGELPDLNTIIKTAKIHYGQYSQLKKKYTDLVSKYAPNKSIIGKVDVKIVWYTRNSRKDADNVACGKKFLLDGLVSAGVIKDDSRRYVNSFQDYFFVDKKNPRVEVELIESEDE